VNVDVAMAVQMRRRKSSFDHSVDLCLALAQKLGSVQTSKRSARDQRWQSVEIASFTSCQ